jgi:phospholipase/lecithinase/hemolysin
MKLKKAALAGAALLSFNHFAHAQNFNQLIAFGDSTTDTGWFARASAGTTFGAQIYNGFIKNSLAKGVMPTLQAPALATLKFLVVSLAFLRILQIRPVEPTMQSAARSMMAFLGRVLKIYFR